MTNLSLVSADYDPFASFTAKEVNDFEQMAPKMAANEGTTVLTPVPEYAPEPDFEHNLLGKPVKVWPYHNEGGELMFYVCRFEKDGKKEIRAYSFVSNEKGQTYWTFKWMPKDRPLYNLEAVTSCQKVLITEGEPAADAGQQLVNVMPVTTLSGGSSAAALTDLSPLKGKEVYIWRDHDDAGIKFEEDVAARALRAGAKNVYVLPLETFNTRPWDGWDLADALEEGWTSETITSLFVSGFLNYRELPAVYPGRLEEDFFFPYDLRYDGLYYLHYTKNGEGVEYKISSPIEVLAKTRDFDGKGWGYQVQVQSSDRHWNEEIIPSAEFAGNGNEVTKRLYELGLVPYDAPQADKRLLQYIQTCPTMERARTVDFPGWKNGKFVTPNKVYGGKDDEKVIMLNKSQVDFEIKGTLYDWQTQVAKPCEGNSRFVFAISASFAAPLLELIGAETSGFHFRGESSSGKTTILKVGGSVHGVDKLTWRSTDNCLETTFASLNHCMQPMDELAQLDPKAATHIAYMLGNGKGKGRMTQSGKARKTYEWLGICCSTGEISMADKLQEYSSNRKETAGEKNRLSDIPADAGKEMGTVEQLNGFEDSKALIDHLNKAVREYRGTAADAYFDYIANNRHEVTERTWELVSEFEKKYAPKDASSQVLRTLNRFAIVAAGGTIAIEQGILPWDKDEAFKGAAACFHAWLKERGGSESAELIQGFRNLKENLERYEGRHFGLWTNYVASNEQLTTNTYDCWGWKKENTTTGEPEYYVTTAGFKQLTGGITSDSFKQHLVKHGWLDVPAEGFKKQVRLPNKKRKWLYVITPQDEG